MRTIAIEEHFLTPHKALNVKKSHDRVKSPLKLYDEEQNKVMPMVYKKLFDLAEIRLADMDAAGIDMQVLQYSGAYLALKDQATAVSMARDSNDKLAEAIKAHKNRFAGFAQLALQDPENAAAELERCVTRLGFKGGVWSGTCKGLFLDHPSFQPVLAEAERLDVPIYLHPGGPPPEVFNAYFSGLPDGISGTFSLAGWGWHAEMGLHSLRLVLAGVFDRFPKLQIIIGHMGENLPFSLARCDAWLSPLATHLERRVADYFQTNFHITTSGYFALQPLLCALNVLGADRIMFAVDYPYSSNEEGRRFLETAPLSSGDLAKISYQNAERLLKI
ncbi:MAG: amidohydrolase family protein [Thermincola sp.]|jgi:predicted TIM-barrel fold metal-dependent hydrolase|nr:amidohydrolase family protein [Thermincola sp.]MDT3702884.1 amidohydrolase family protein [Thermincola sp.]